MIILYQILYLLFLLKFIHFLYGLSKSAPKAQKIAI